MTLVILAAGMGSRYGGMKQIDPINEDGNFIIDFSIYDAIKSGFDKVVFIIKEENLEVFKQTIGNRISKHIKVEYAFQRISDVPEWFDLPNNRIKPWGTTQAILSSEACVNEPFAVINSDDFYGRESFEIIANHLNSTCNAKKPQFCMAGYLLKNTVTEHGSVNRGICNVDENGLLLDIEEAREISLNEKGVALYPVGEISRVLSPDTIVSMNCWGFTPDIFKYMKMEFERFLKNIKNPAKDESYLADVIDMVIKNDFCDIVVYNTNATWLGVTYPQDKPTVVRGIKKLINDGVYPEHLWN